VKKILYKIHKSPTITTWGIHSLRFLYLILVIPLLIKHFNSIELAAFLLFDSVFELSTLLSQRLLKTFIRVASYGLGGATSLKPFKGGEIRENIGEPDWSLIGKIYRSCELSFLFLGFISFFIITIVGYFGISNLLNGAESKNIWLAFNYVCISTFLINTFFGYEAILKGLGGIATANVNTIIFRGLNILILLIAIYLKKEIHVIVLWLQTVRVINAFYKKILLDNILSEKLNSATLVKAFDKEVIISVFEPTWKGMISSFSSIGVRQLGGVIFTSVANPSVVASYYLSLKVMSAIAQISQAPFSSLTPIYAKMRAKNQLKDLLKLFRRRIFLSLSILSAISLLFTYAGSELMSILSKEVDFIDDTSWIFLSIFFLYDRYMVFLLSTIESGNDVRYYWQDLICGIITLIIMYPLILIKGVLGMVLSFLIPKIMIFNIGPIFLSAKTFKVSVSKILDKRLIFIFIVQFTFLVMNIFAS